MTLAADRTGARATAAPTGGAPVVAIVGAGFSGSLLALHLLRAGPARLRVLLIDRAGGFGRGLAYATRDPGHLLNVRAGNMSAFPDQPDHLLRWLERQPGTGEVPPSAFITRETYGRYVASLLREVVARPDGAGRLVLVHDAAIGLDETAGRLSLALAMGRRIAVDAVALASGNAPPARIEGLGRELAPGPLYAPDPWAADALDGLPKNARVLLLGTGLTMVDVAVSLAGQGVASSMLALSRRGLAPHRHQGFNWPAPAARPLLVGPLSRQLRAVRRRAREIGWREAVDELRPSTQAIWRAADPAQRRRFLRHLRPWWDVHRHRMAPAVADRIEAMRRDGRLTLSAGRIVSVEADGGLALVRWRPRGGEEARADRFDRIVNCTGVGGLDQRPDDPLLRQLIGSGLARPDPLSLGLDVDAAGRVIGADGQARPDVFAVGPITRGALWEIVAVPDIRNQVAETAAHLVARLVMQAEGGPARDAAIP